ncbi:MAG TPA: C-type lectin domain-containing protein [Kofleriaceae bacterium]|nr:C-type lectin domain-containing protein [Kofleriaceae bacterium]
MRGWPTLLLVAGCGRIGFGDAGDDPDVPPVEAGIDAPVDAPAIDAPGEPAICRSDPRYASLGALPHRYRTVLALTSWSQAKAACAADGAYLAIPGDATEAAALDGDWMGLTDVAVEGQWLTVFGAPAPFLPWGAGEPAGGTGKNCARLGSTPALLEARDCNDTRDYVCECD